MVVPYTIIQRSDRRLIGQRTPNAERSGLFNSIWETWYGRFLAEPGRIRRA